MLVAYSWFVSFINYFWFTSVVISFIRRLRLLKIKIKSGSVELLICFIISVFPHHFQELVGFDINPIWKATLNSSWLVQKQKNIEETKWKKKQMKLILFFLTSTWHWWWTFYYLVILLVIQILNISNAFLPFNKYIH